MYTKRYKCLNIYLFDVPQINAWHKICWNSDTRVHNWITWKKAIFHNKKELKKINNISKHNKIRSIKFKLLFIRMKNIFFLAFLFSWHFVSYQAFVLSFFLFISFSFRYKYALIFFKCTLYNKQNFL